MCCSMAFDLGVGMLFGLPNSEARRRAMLGAVAPIWDGNETWLVVTGVILWGLSGRLCRVAVGFLYSCHLHAAGPDPARGGVRIPQQVAAVALDLGSELCRRFAGRDFHTGVMVGALVEGLPIANGEYTGGEFGWFSAVFGAVRHRSVPWLCASRRLLAGQEVRGRGSRHRSRQIPVLAVGVLVFLVVVFVYALAEHLPILHRWIDRPYLFVFP